MWYQMVDTLDVCHHRNLRRMYMELLLKVLPILHLEEVSATDLLYNYLNANLIQEHDVADTVVGRSVGNG